MYKLCGCHVNRRRSVGTCERLTAIDPAWAIFSANALISSSSAYRLWLHLDFVFITIPVLPLPCRLTGHRWLHDRTERPESENYIAIVFSISPTYQRLFLPYRDWRLEVNVHDNQFQVFLRLFSRRSYTHAVDNRIRPKRARSTVECFSEMLSEPIPRLATWLTGRVSLR